MGTRGSGRGCEKCKGPFPSPDSEVRFQRGGSTTCQVLQTHKTLGGSYHPQLPAVSVLMGLVNCELSEGLLSGRSGIEDHAFLSSLVSSPSWCCSEAPESPRELGNVTDCVPWQ